MPLVHSVPCFLLSSFPCAHCHRATFRTWSLDQQCLEGYPAVQDQPLPAHAGDSAALQRPSLSLAASGEMPCCHGFLTQEHVHKAVPNYKNWLHLGDDCNIKMRLMVFYYSTVWTGSRLFSLEAAHRCSFKLLLCSRFLALEFPSLFSGEN